MRSLVRTRSGIFRIDEAMTLEEAARLAGEGRLQDKLLPPDYALKHLPRVLVSESMNKQVRNGAKIPVTEKYRILDEAQPVRIYLQDRFWGIAERQGDELRWKVQISPEEDPEDIIECM